MKENSTIYTPKKGEPFLEPPELDDHLGLYLQVDEVLLNRRTRYQDLAVIKSGPLGKVLLLDGAIQVTGLGEAPYHEMLAHVPLLCHPNPEKVLIIGGGDGGLLCQVLRHPEVRKADLCEIDAEVIDAARDHFPELSRSFDDPRATLHIKDGVAFISDNARSYDVILVDSSDPDPGSPAQALYTEDFYRRLKGSLRPGGIISSQIEAMSLYRKLIQSLFSFMPGMFDRAHYYVTQVPTYLTGVIGFSFCSLGPPPWPEDEEKHRARLAALGPMEYYTTQMHRAAFCLPAAWRKLLPISAQVDLI